MVVCQMCHRTECPDAVSADYGIPLCTPCEAKLRNQFPMYVDPANPTEQEEKAFEDARKGLLALKGELERERPV